MDMYLPRKNLNLFTKAKYLQFSQAALLTTAKLKEKISLYFFTLLLLFSYLLLLLLVCLFYYFFFTSCIGFSKNKIVSSPAQKGVIHWRGGGELTIKNVVFFCSDKLQPHRKISTRLTTLHDWTGLFFTHRND